MVPCNRYLSERLLRSLSPSSLPYNYHNPPEKARPSSSRHTPGQPHISAKKVPSSEASTNGKATQTELLPETPRFDSAGRLIRLRSIFNYCKHPGRYLLSQAGKSRIDEANAMAHEGQCSLDIQLFADPSNDLRTLLAATKEEWDERDIFAEIYGLTVIQVEQHCSNKDLMSLVSMRATIKLNKEINEQQSHAILQKIETILQCLLNDPSSAQHGRLIRRISTKVSPEYKQLGKATSRRWDDRKEPAKQTKFQDGTESAFICSKQAGAWQPSQRKFLPAASESFNDAKDEWSKGSRSQAPADAPKSPRRQPSG
jgi:hypothetical protein